MNDRGQERGANPTLLKQDIDAGLTGDKIGYPDPAAAPLGTDDEAAGTPITQSQLDMARRAEREQGARAAQGHGGTGARTARSNRAWLMMIGVAVLVVLLLVLAL